MFYESNQIWPKIKYKSDNSFKSEFLQKFILPTRKRKRKKDKK